MLKSICDKTLKPTAPHLIRSLESEDLVLKDNLNCGDQLLHRNYKVAGVEIDLILKTKCNIILFIEVKTLSDLDRLATRLSQKQLKRLQKAKKIFEQQHNCFVELQLATVHYNRIDRFVVG